MQCIWRLGRLTGQYHIIYRLQAAGDRIQPSCLQLNQHNRRIVEIGWGSPISLCVTETQCACPGTVYFRFCVVSQRRAKVNETRLTDISGTFTFIDSLIPLFKDEKVTKRVREETTEHTRTHRQTDTHTNTHTHLHAYVYNKFNKYSTNIIEKQSF